MTRLLPAVALASLVGALAACEKNAAQRIDAPTTGAYVKFYNEGINAPGVNFFANDQKVTAVSSTSCTVPTDARCTTTGIETLTGTTYGNQAIAGLYATIDPGTYTLSARIAPATDNGVVSSQLANVTLEAGKYYSVFQSGFYTATGTPRADAFIVADAFPSDFDYTLARVRFVNASSNSQPMTLWLKSTTTSDSAALATNVAYKSASQFVSVGPVPVNLTVRYAGSNTAMITLSSITFTPGRTYTVVARGDMTVTSTTAATRPILDNTTNR